MTYGCIGCGCSDLFDVRFMVMVSPSEHCFSLMEPDIDMSSKIVSINDNRSSAD